MESLDRRDVLLAVGATLSPLPALAKSSLAKPGKSAIEAVSPNGALRVRLALGDAGPTWSVQWRARSILAPSALGLVLPDGRTIGPGARAVKTSSRAIKGQWSPPFGIRKHYDQACTEVTLDIADPVTGAVVSIVARAYDHGCAVRYVLRGAGKARRLTLAGEATRFEPARRRQALFQPRRGRVPDRSDAGGPVDPAPHPDLTGSSDKSVRWPTCP
jgi:alpha-glucosidase